MSENEKSAKPLPLVQLNPGLRLKRGSARVTAEQMREASVRFSQGFPESGPPEEKAEELPKTQHKRRRQQSSLAGQAKTSSDVPRFERKKVAEPRSHNMGFRLTLGERYRLENVAVHLGYASITEYLRVNFLRRLEEDEKKIISGDEQASSR